MTALSQFCFNVLDILSDVFEVVYDSLCTIFPTKSL